MEYFTARTAFGEGMKACNPGQILAEDISGERSVVLTCDESADEADKAIDAGVLQQAGPLRRRGHALPLTVGHHMLHTDVQEAVCQLITLQAHHALHSCPLSFAFLNVPGLTPS